MLGYIVSSENNVTYNLILGKIFGMCSAIYLGLILTEYNKAVLGKKLYQDKYVGLTREYIFERTLLSEHKQIDVEENLIECSVLERVKASNSNSRFYYKVDEKYLLKIIEARKDDKLDFALAPKKTAEPIANDTKKVTKKQLQVADAMKEVNLLEPSAEIRELYATWIDVLITRFGYVAKSSLRINVKELEMFSKGVIQVKHDVLTIAVKNGWKDIQYSINDYKKEHAGSVNTRSSVENKYQVQESKDEKEAALAETAERLKRGGNDVF